MSGGSLVRVRARVERPENSKAERGQPTKPLGRLLYFFLSAELGQIIEHGAPLARGSGPDAGVHEGTNTKRSCPHGKD